MLRAGSSDSEGRAEHGVEAAQLAVAVGVVGLGERVAEAVDPRVGGAHAVAGEGGLTSTKVKPAATARFRMFALR